MTTTPESRKSAEESANVTNASRVTDFSIQKILGNSSNVNHHHHHHHQAKTNILPEPIVKRREEQQHSPIKVIQPIPKKPLPNLGILDLSKTKGNPSMLHGQVNVLRTDTGPYYSPYLYNGATLTSNTTAAVAAANAQKFYANLFPQMFCNQQTYPGNLSGGGYSFMNTQPMISSVGPMRYFTPYGGTSILQQQQQQHLQQQQQQQEPSVIRLPATLSQLKSNLKNSVTTSPDTVGQRRNETCSECLDVFQKRAFNAPTTMYSRLPYTKILDKNRSMPVPSTHTKIEEQFNLKSVTVYENASTSMQNIANVRRTKVDSTNSINIINTTTMLARKSCRDLSMSVSTVNRAELDSISSNTEEISYKCRICEKVFGCSQTLQAHEKTHKSPRYECSDCGKGFSQLRNYKYHLSVHRGTKEFAAECPECGKTFNDKGYLSSHMKIHRNKKEYECPYCPKSFNQRVAFNMHVRIHTGVKPHKCAECGKRFSRKMLLKQHMRTHSGEKPYQCSVCGKSFADRSNMTLHHRLHSGIKPFNCPICPKAFTKKHHLKTHLNYHTGCKPYVCPHPNCHQAFTQSSNMRTHAKKCQYGLTDAVKSTISPTLGGTMSYPVTTTNTLTSSSMQVNSATTGQHDPLNVSTMVAISEGNGGLISAITNTNTDTNTNINTISTIFTNRTLGSSSTLCSSSTMTTTQTQTTPTTTTSMFPSVQASLSLLNSLRPF